MKKIVIIVIIGAMTVLFSIKKPIKNTQSETVIIKQNIGLPDDAVKRLNKFLNP